MSGSDVVDLTSALVAIDSINPSLEPGAAGESEVAAFVADWARDAGLEVELVEATPRPAERRRLGARQRWRALAAPLRASRHRRRGGHGGPLRAAHRG